LLNEDLIYVLKLATGLVSIVNPIGAIPRFITLMGDRPRSEGPKLALKTTLAMMATLLISSLAGEIILEAFGITLPSFQIGGGILVLLIAISMLYAQPNKAKYSLEEAAEALDKEDFTVVPMAIPFLAGPGAISTVILDAHQADAGWQKFALWAMILFTSIVVYIALRLAGPIRERIGQTGVNIATRLMGLLLAAIAIEFITRGLGQTFPGLLASSGANR
jgi:multiple antibiotic resistance protein